MIYEQLKTQVETDCSKLIETYEAAKRKLLLLRKRKSDADEQLSGLKSQKEKLTASADESLADSVAGWEKFQGSLKKVNAQIESLDEAVTTLSTRIIPEAEKEVNRTANELRLSLRGICITSAKTITGEMNGLLNCLVELHDEQYAATRQIYGDYEFTPNVYDGVGIYVNPAHNRIDFKIVPLSALAIAKQIQEAGSVQRTKPPVAPVLEPTQPEKLIVPLDDAEQLKKQADEWKDNAFGPTPDPTPVEIVNPEPGGEAGNEEISVEVTGDITKKIEGT
jgi:hypothetical protein